MGSKKIIYPIRPIAIRTTTKIDILQPMKTQICINNSETFKPFKMTKSKHMLYKRNLTLKAQSCKLYWKLKLQDLNKIWDNKAKEKQFNDNYHFINLNRNFYKLANQQKCLLLFLQITESDNKIVLYKHLNGNNSGFIGISGFQIIDKCFKKDFLNLFPSDAACETTKFMLRRANLIPLNGDWDKAWNGENYFEYKK